MAFPNEQGSSTGKRKRSPQELFSQIPSLYPPVPTLFVNPTSIAIDGEFPAINQAPSLFNPFATGPGTSITPIVQRHSGVTLARTPVASGVPLGYNTDSEYIGSAASVLALHGANARAEGATETNRDHSPTAKRARLTTSSSVSSLPMTMSGAPKPPRRIPLNYSELPTFGAQETHVHRPVRPTSHNIQTMDLSGMQAYATSSTGTVYPTEGASNQTSFCTASTTMSETVLHPSVGSMTVWKPSEGDTVDREQMSNISIQRSQSPSLSTFRDSTSAGALTMRTKGGPSMPRIVPQVFSSKASLAPAPHIPQGIPFTSYGVQSLPQHPEPTYHTSWNVGTMHPALTKDLGRATSDVHTAYAVQRALNQTPIHSSIIVPSATPTWRSSGSAIPPVGSAIAAGPLEGYPNKCGETSHDSVPLFQNTAPPELRSSASAVSINLGMKGEPGMPRTTQQGCSSQTSRVNAGITWVTRPETEGFSSLPGGTVQQDYTTEPSNVGVSARYLYPRAQAGTSGFFTGSRNFGITNSNFNETYQTYNISTATNANESAALDILKERTITGVEYDSSERDDPPLCHPGTRLSIRKDAQEWFRNLNRSENILWLHGPAGVGKSAILQSLAEDESGSLNSILGATFFFSRPKRFDDPLRLFTTIAYQLATKYQSYRQYVVNTLTRDFTIASKSTATQFQWFIKRPFIEEGVIKGLPPTVVVLIDGLDECKSIEAQREIISLIGCSVRHLRTPLVWVIASRPEPYIENAFLSLSEARIPFKEVTIDVDSDEACREMEQYLRDKFNDVRKRYRSFFPASRLWPSEVDFAEVSSAASGHFGFGSTIMRFIVDENYGNPVSQLETVISVIRKAPSSGNKPNPLAILDALYTEILSRVPQDILPTTMTLLAIRFSRHEDFRYEGSEDHYSEFFMTCQWAGCSLDDVKSAFWKLHSVVRLDTESTLQTKPEAFHASFTDYLKSPKRSGRFTIQDPSETLGVGAVRLLLQSYNAVDNTYDSSKIQLLWPVPESITIKTDILDTTFYAVFNHLECLISKVDTSRDANQELAAFFEDLDYASGAFVEDNAPIMREFGQCVTPSTLDILSGWGICRKISIRSINLDYIKSNGFGYANFNRTHMDRGENEEDYIPEIFESGFKESELDERLWFLNPRLGKLDLVHLRENSSWREDVRKHLWDIEKLQELPPVYIVGKRGKSFLAIIHRVPHFDSNDWWYILPYDLP